MTTGNPHFENGIPEMPLCGRCNKPKDEQWKEVGGFDGYQVSNFGRMKSVDRCVYNPAQGVHKMQKGRILKQQTAYYGYKYIDMSVKGKKKPYLVHRLVAKEFIDNVNNYPYVCHKDDNPSNNFFYNLFWGTQKMNMDDMKSKGRGVKPEDKNFAKLNIYQVRVIKHFANIPNRITTHVLANMFNVDTSTITRIWTNKTWKHINI